MLFAWQKWGSILKSAQWHGGHSVDESSNTCCAGDFFPPHQPPLLHQRTAGHQLHASLSWNSKTVRCRTDAHYWGSDLKGCCYISANLGAVCWCSEMVMSFDFHLGLLFCGVTYTRCLMETYGVMSRVVTFGTNAHYIYIYITQMEADMLWAISLLYLSLLHDFPQDINVTIKLQHYFLMSSEMLMLVCGNFLFLFFTFNKCFSFKFNNIFCQFYCFWNGILLHVEISNVCWC